MKKILSIFKLDLTTAFYERADMLIYALSGCAGPLLILIVWLIVTPIGSSSVFERNTLILYFIFTMIAKLLSSAWGGQFVAARIKRGAISPHLTMPVSYISFQISNNVAEKVIKLVYLIPTLSVISYLFGVSYSQISPENVFLSLFSLCLACAIYFLLDYCIGLAAFWLDESHGLLDVLGVFSAIFSGMIIPIVALPSNLQNLSYILPFRYTLSLPVEIILGQLENNLLITSLAIQLFWTIALWSLAQKMWQRGLEKYSASGA